MGDNVYMAKLAEQAERYEEMVERDRTCIAEIWEHCFKEDMSRLGTRESNRIRSCMKQIKGWSDKTRDIRFGKRYGKVKGYKKL